MAIFSKKQSDTPRRRQESSRIDKSSSSNDASSNHVFKRNRTLTGSLSSRITAVNEDDAQLKSERVHAHELARRRRRIGLVLVVVIIILCMLYSLAQQFTVSPIVKADDLSINLDSSYAEIIQAYLSAKPIERFRFLTNVDQLNVYTQARAPEIASIRSDGSGGFGKSGFIITVRKPIAGWSINGQQRYVDDTGTSFSRNYFVFPSVQIIDQSGAQIQTGQAVASGRFLGFVGRAVGAAKTYGYKVLQVIIPVSTTRQVELHVEGVAYPIKLSIDRGVGEQVEDMVNAIHWFAAHKLSPQYVDVRVGGKAYYR